MAESELMENVLADLDRLSQEMGRAHDEFLSSIHELTQVQVLDAVTEATLTAA